MEDISVSLKEGFKKVRDAYVVNQVQRLKLPEFSSDHVRRYKIIFSGRVQKVGFRLAVCELARRLDLTGYCQNLENGDVLAEIQGPNEKIKYLVSFLESLVRIKIREKKVEKLAVLTGETEFVRK